MNVTKVVMAEDIKHLPDNATNVERAAEVGRLLEDQQFKGVDPASVIQRGTMNVTVVADFSKLDTSKHTPEERMLRTFKNVFHGIGFQKEATVRLVDWRCGITKMETAGTDLMILYQCREHTIEHPDPEKARDWDTVTLLMSKFRVVI